jgi:ribokinase
VPNQTELAILTGLPTATRAEAEIAARRVVEAGIGSVIVTLGADGALLVQAGAGPGGAPARPVHVPPVPVTSVDTTGAGDAFIGAFAHRFVAGDALAESLAFAARYAADSITRPGTQKAFADRASFAG